MNRKQQCFGCHGFYGDGDIASEKRSSYHALTRNPNVDKSDLLIIKAFYDEHIRSYKTSLCWECSLCRVLEYTSKYDGMRNSGWCLLQFIKPHKTASMFIQERGEELIERFSYCSYTFHHHYVNQRQYHFIWKVFTSCRQHLTVHCKHKRDKDTSWHQWMCFFPDIKLYLNIFALSNKLWTVSCCILWYLVVSYFN